MSGRIRTIKPELLEDETTAGLSHEAWRLFVSGLLLADDYGNLRASPALLAGSVFWARESFATLPGIIRELVASGLWVAYSVRGQPYAHIAGWGKHQRVDKPGKPRCPGPSERDETPSKTEDSRESPESVANHSGTIPGSLAPDLRPPTPTSDPDHPPVVPPTGDIPKRTRTKRADPQPYPDDLDPSKADLDCATRERVDLDSELPRFRDHHLARGSKFSDWHAALRTWLRNARKFADERAGTPEPQRTPDEERAARAAYDAKIAAQMAADQARCLARAKDPPTPPPPGSRRLETGNLW